MKFFSVFLLLALSISFLVSCELPDDPEEEGIISGSSSSSSSTGSSTEIIRRTGAINIDIGSGSTPSISWDKCNATLLGVHNLESGQLIWTIGALDFGSGFASPVRYGTMPFGAVSGNEDPGLSTFSYETLKAGKKYQISILGAEGGLSGVLEFQR